MMRLMKKLRPVIALLLCIMMIFNTAAFDTGHISYAATTLNLQLTLNSNGSITSNWSQVSGAKYYTLLLVDPASNTCYANQENLTETTYTSIANLPANVNYSVVVTVYGSNNVSIDSELGKILIPYDFYKNAIPGVPQNVGASSTSTSATVSWDSVDGATSYELLFNGTGYNVTGTSKTVTGLSPNTTYTYSVRAKNAEGVGSYSSSKTITTPTSASPVPAVPTNITATATTTTATVSWNAVDGATSYGVVFDGKFYTAAGTSKTVTGLSPNTTYGYAVCADNAGGSSAFSATKKITTIPIAPEVPANVNASGTSDSVTVSWSEAAGATSYDVMFNGSAYNVTGTSRTFTGLSPNTSYTYSVRANNSAGSSAYSSSKTIKTTLAAPTNITATATSNSITISWSAVEGATSYDIKLNGTIYNVTGTSKTFTGLEPFTSYGYTVCAKKGSEEGQISDFKGIATLPAAPAMPTGVNASPSDTSIIILWDSVYQAKSYDVMFNGATYNVPGNYGFKTFTGLTPETNYTYSVRANNDGGSSSYSKTQTVKTLPKITVITIPATPKNVTAIPASYSITVNWSPVSGASYYEAVLNGYYYQTVNGISATFDGLYPNGNYDVRVRAGNERGLSDYSVSQRVTTLKEPPAAASDVTATATENTVTVSWSSVKGAEYYDLIFNGRTYTNVGGLRQSYTVGGLPADTDHTYAVCVRSEGGSIWSDTKTIRTRLNTPTNIRAVQTEDTIEISWSPVTGATSYDVTFNEATYNVSGTSKTFTGLTQDSSYLYSVRANNSYGSSAYSPVMMTKTLGNTLEMPENVKAASTLNNVTVSWSPVKTATDYYVDFNGKTTKVTGTSKTFSGLKPNTKNSYSVRANSPLGFSSYSPTQTISTKISKKATVQNVKSNKTYEVGKKSYTGLDPVNALTGSFIWNYTLLEDQGKDPLHFTVMYDSQGDEYQKALGSKWTYSLNYMLYMDSDYAYFSTPNGEVIPFHINPSGGEYQLVAGIKSDYTMGKKDDRTYFVRELDGTEYQFDTSLCLSKIIEGGLVTYLFRGNNEGQIVSIAGQYGGILTLEYTDGHITQVSDVMGNTVSFDYDGDYLVSATNPDSDSILFTYDDLANLLTITDFSGNINLTNQYDSNSRVVMQNLAGRGESSALYDEENRTTTFIDELGNPTVYTYDEAMNVTGVEVAGTTVQNRYNDKGQVTEEIDELGNTTRMEYDELGRLSQVTYPDNTHERITYNERNYPVRVVNRDGSEIGYQYDANNNMISLKNEHGNTEYFSYDNNDNLLSHTDKNGNISTYTYDSNQNLETYTDPEGNIYRYSQDAIGRLCSFTSPTGNKTVYQYSAAGKLLCIVDGDGTVAFDYDKNGNQTGIKDRTGSEQRLVYNEMGQVTLATDFMGNEYKFTYDKKGNMIEETDPLGYNQSYVYDAMGNVVSWIDKNGNETSHTFDAASQLTEIKDAAGNTTKYTYDTMGQIKSVIDPRNNQTLYFYDAMGHITDVINALGCQEKYTYDKTGNLLTETDEDGVVKTYSYDKENRLASITSDAGTIRFTYDKLGRLISTEDTDKYSKMASYDADGNMTELFDKERNKTTYAYDSSGRLSKETDQKGNQTLYEYDRNGNCTKITDVEGNEYSYQYDANNQLTKVTDPMGHATSYAYNTRGELESVTDAGGGKTVFTYDGNGNLIKEVNPIGGAKTYIYDSLDRLTGIEDENGYKLSCSYDAVGNMTSYTDANQNKWTYEYDAMSRLTGVTDQNGGHMELSYGNRGELLKVTDQEGAETSYRYDSIGRMIEMRDALDNCQSFVYDSLDRVIKQTDANGNATEYEYSPSGNLLSIKDSEGNKTTYTYNALGQVLTETDALGNVVSCKYDALGQVTSITDPMGGKTSFTYTARGEIDNVTDAKGNITSYQYDANGNLTKTTDALGNVAAYEYDAMNNQIKESAPSSGEQTYATIYQYDKKGQIVKEINPLLQEKTYSYDGNGNIVKILDEDLYETEVVYDLNNQPTSMRYSDGKEATFRYNKKGELVELKDWTGIAKMEYDKMGSLIKVTDHNGQATGYGYDANGNTTSIAYPDGSKVSYTYDKNNRMTKVVDAEKQITQYTYDYIGNTVQIQQPGSTTTYSYNKNSLPVQISYLLGDGTRMEDNLTYDALGNIISSSKKGSTSELTEHTAYSYDALGQLLSYTKGQMNESYIYDMFGNRIEKSVNGSQEATYQYNGLNQLISKMENEITYSYQYDKRGNQIKELCGDKLTLQYTYDATNHMVMGRNLENGEKSEYTYNALYMRVKNVQMMEQTGSSYESYGEPVSGENQQESFRIKETNYVIDYLSDTNNELLSLETRYGATRVTYGCGSERLSQKVTIFLETSETIRTDIAQENNGKTYFQSDRLGSVLFASNQEGEVLRYASRDVWGNLQIQVHGDMNAAGIENSLGFTNYSYDSVIDKYFAQARFYDAGQGRMLAVDPIKGNMLNPQSLNPYAYVLNNPLKWVDPLGLTPTAVNHTLFTNIETLYALTASYKPNASEWSRAELTLQFLRMDSPYKKGNWDAVAGKIDSGFVEYVKKNDIGIYTYFEKVHCMRDSNGNDIDSRHFFAVLNANLHDSTFANYKTFFVGQAHIKNLAGWAGDLQTFVLDVKKASNNITDYKTLYNLAYRMMGKSNTTFPMDDLYADTDAYNIYRKMKKGESFINALNSYYDSGYETRFTSFTNGWSKNKIRSVVGNYTKKNWMPGISWPLYGKEKISGVLSRAVSDAFTNFIWKFVQKERR